MLAQNLTPLILLGILMFGVIGGINILFQHDNLNNIKSRTVGDGQYGTARFATEQEIHQTYHFVPFEPELWRRGQNLPEAQGIVVGCRQH